ncbi:MAG: hypothetical protein WBD17_08405, partial [Candidatus Omnitrophota bacterium]
FNAAWQSWQDYEQDGGLSAGQPTNAYMTASLTQGVTHYLGDKEKTFGDGSLTYETNDIMSYAAGAFITSKPEGMSPRTDENQRKVMISTYEPNFNFDRLRPSTVTYTSDSGYKKAKIFQDMPSFYFDDKGKMLSTKADVLGVSGGVFEVDPFGEATIDKVFARDGERLQSTIDFIGMAVIPMLRRAGYYGEAGVEAGMFRARVAGREITLLKGYGEELVSGLGISLGEENLRGLLGLEEELAEVEERGMERLAEQLRAGGEGVRGARREPGEEERPVEGVRAERVEAVQRVTPETRPPAEAETRLTRAEIIEKIAEFIRGEEAREQAYGGEGGPTLEIEGLGIGMELETRAEGRPGEELVVTIKEAGTAGAVGEVRMARAEVEAEGGVEALVGRVTELVPPSAEVRAEEAEVMERVAPAAAEAPGEVTEAKAVTPGEFLLEAIRAGGAAEAQFGEVVLRAREEGEGRELVVTAVEAETGKEIGVLKIDVGKAMGEGAREEGVLGAAAMLFGELAMGETAEVAAMEGGLEQLGYRAEAFKAIGVTEIKLWVPTELMKGNIEGARVLITITPGEERAEIRAVAVETAAGEIVAFVTPAAAEGAVEETLGIKLDAQSGQQILTDLGASGARITTSLDQPEAQENRRDVLGHITDIAKEFATTMVATGAEMRFASSDLVFGAGVTQERREALMKLNVDLRSSLGTGAELMAPVSLLAGVAIQPAGMPTAADEEAAAEAAVAMAEGAEKLEQVVAILRAPTPTREAFTAKAMALAKVAGIGIEGRVGGELIKSAVQAGELSIIMDVGTAGNVTSQTMLEMTVDNLNKAMPEGTTGRNVVTAMESFLARAVLGRAEIAPAAITPGAIATPVEAQSVLTQTRLAPPETSGPTLELGSEATPAVDAVTPDVVETQPVERGGEATAELGGAPGSASGAAITPADSADEALSRQAEGVTTPTAADVVASVRRDTANVIRTAPRGTKDRDRLVRDLIVSANQQGLSLDAAHGSEVAGAIRDVLIDSGVPVARAFGAASAQDYMRNVDRRVEGLIQAVGRGEMNLTEAKSKLDAFAAELQSAVNVGLISSDAMGMALDTARGFMGQKFLGLMDRAGAGLSRAVGSGDTSIGAAGNALDSMGSSLMGLVSAGFISQDAAELELGIAKSSIGYNFMKRMDSTGGGIGREVGTGDLAGANLTGAITDMTGEMNAAIEGGFISSDDRDIEFGSTVMQVGQGAAQRAESIISTEGGIGDTLTRTQATAVATGIKENIGGALTDAGADAAQVTGALAGANRLTANAYMRGKDNEVASLAQSVGAGETSISA